MQKKSEIFKKRNFLGQALDFLPPRKPGLYISRVDFSLNIMDTISTKSLKQICLHFPQLPLASVNSYVTEVLDTYFPD